MKIGGISSHDYGLTFIYPKKNTSIFSYWVDNPPDMTAIAVVHLSNGFVVGADWSLSDD